MRQRWTIRQLTRLVETALEVAPYQGQSSGRVRTVPDLRTIRYYTTIGLLDPPAEMRGRTAYYSRRHVMQLVAIKRMQAQGMPLVDIQKELAGIDGRELSRAARLPADFWTNAAPEETNESPPMPYASPEAQTQRANEFWKIEPERAARIASPAEQPASKGADSKPVRTALCLSLREGVEMILTGIDSRRIEDEALARLTPILELLADTLDDLRLIPGTQPSKIEFPSETTLSAKRGDS